MTLTPSLEDYLEAIAVLSQEGGRPRVGSIGRFLSVKAPSVNAALGVLRDRGLVSHEPYGAVELTPAGKKRAQTIHRRHRVIVAFLQDVLRLPHGTAQRDACRIEHCICPETAGRISEFMRFVGKGGPAGAALDGFRPARKSRRPRVLRAPRRDSSTRAVPPRARGRAAGRASGCP